MGSFHSEARLSDSWKAPMLLAPSPKQTTVTRPSLAEVRRGGKAHADRQSAADDAGSDHYTGFGVRDVHGAALPLQAPVALPKISANSSSRGHALGDLVMHAAVRGDQVVLVADTCV